eukprot:776596-Karenia_brevis.AAC.1
MSRRAAAQVTQAKADALLRSRSFFSLRYERNFVRPIAVRLGYLPADVEVIQDENGRIHLRSEVSQSNHVFEGMQSACDADGYARGARNLFPSDASSFKYFALFDQ